MITSKQDYNTTEAISLSQYTIAHVAILHWKLTPDKYYACTYMLGNRYVYL